MTDRPNVLLLVGSAKRQGSSTSEALGNYLCERLLEHGWAFQKMYIHNALRTETRFQSMAEAVDTAHLVMLATPLYVDSLPCLVTAALEQIAAHRNRAPAGLKRSPRFVTVINCGFPEAQHNEVALAICRQFATSTGLAWSGGLSMGGGGTINGVPLEKLGRRASAIRQALDDTAAAIVLGQPVPEAAVKRLAAPVIPAWMYTSIGNLGWHRTAQKQGVHSRLYDRPFEG